jgi:hypothetical protein
MKPGNHPILIDWSGANSCRSLVFWKIRDPAVSRGLFSWEEVILILIKVVSIASLLVRVEKSTYEKEVL